MFGRHWRGCKEWMDYGSPLSTTSDVASKMYDASLHQVLGWYDDQSVGGLDGSLKAMLEADPNFLIGHVMSIALKLTGTYTLSQDDPIRKDVNNLLTLSKSLKLTQNEERHVEAVGHLIDGDLTSALHEWDRILIEDPLDVLAIRLSFFGYFFLGQHIRSRDLILRILPEWKQTMPMYGYILGMSAFGFQEACDYDKAEKVARTALDINPNDIYSTHALSHVMEMQGRTNEGIAVLKNTENNWNICRNLACHIYWHYSLYHVEQGNFEEALGIFDSKIIKSYKKTRSYRNLTDASSLLYRLDIEGIPVKERWKDVQEICMSTVEKHTNSFIDAHVIMSCLGADDKQSTTKFVETFTESVKGEKGYSRNVGQNLMLPMCEALVAHDNGDHARAVELFYPIRHDVYAGGGSNAQRDVYNLFLIDAGLKSHLPHHNKLARFLLAERKSLKENSPMTDRLIERSLAVH